MTENTRNNNPEFGDDREMQRLIKMASALANDNMKRKDNSQATSLVLDNISNTIDETVKKPESTSNAEPASNVERTKSTTPDNNTSVTSTSVPPSTIQLFNIFGFSFPKSTLYFILVSIALAVILYYWTSPSKLPDTHYRDDDDTDN
jgi:hypothetical protein